MQNIFQNKLEKDARADYKELKELYSKKTLELQEDVTSTTSLLSKEQKTLSRLEKEYHAHKENKELKHSDKTLWKNKKVELKGLFKKAEANVSYLEAKLNKANVDLEHIALDQKRDMGNLKSHVLQTLSSNIAADSEICSHIKVTVLATKIKLKYTEFERQEIPKNPRVGMSIGANFKPRVYFSTNARKRYKTVKTVDDQYDIRHQDNFDARVTEIAEMLDFENPYNLYQFITDEVKRQSGSQALKEYTK